MAPGPAQQRVSYLYRVAWWASAVLALAGPLLLVRRVGFDETWDAFNRYTAALLEFSGGHEIRVPGLGLAPDEGYTQMDADMIRWHKEMTVLHNRYDGKTLGGLLPSSSLQLRFEHSHPHPPRRIGSMAVVGKVDNDGQLDFEFNRPAALKGARKGGFLPARDLSMLAYLLLSAAAHLSDSVPLSLVVLNLQAFCLAICLRLKVRGEGGGERPARARRCAPRSRPLSLWCRCRA